MDVVDVFDICCGLVGVVVDDVELLVRDVGLLLTDVGRRLINALNGSMVDLNDIGDWDWECCCCCWDEVNPFDIGWWRLDDEDDDENWLWYSGWTLDDVDDGSWELLRWGNGGKSSCCSSNYILKCRI